MMIDWILLGLRIAAPLLLYTFLALVVRHMLIASRAEQRPVDLLRGLNTSNKVLKLEGAATLGRESGNTFVIEGEFVSAQHAALAYRDQAWWITDLGSTNGTFLNDIPIKKSTPLAYGDIVSLGDVQFRLERGRS